MSLLCCQDIGICTRMFTCACILTYITQVYICMPCMQVCGDAIVDLQADAFRAPAPLATFLNFPGSAPIYIGFGALAIPDPVALTEVIYDAARASGKRVLLSRGWADLGKGVESKPENVCLVGNCPHSWLFPKCSAAIHHGGAGTTAAALRAGIPSLVVRCPCCRVRCAHTCIEVRSSQQSTKSTRPELQMQPSSTCWHHSTPPWYILRAYMFRCLWVGNSCSGGACASFYYRKVK